VPSRCTRPAAAVSWRPRQRRQNFGSTHVQMFGTDQCVPRAAVRNAGQDVRCTYEMSDFMCMQAPSSRVQCAHVTGAARHERLCTAAIARIKILEACFYDRTTNLRRLQCSCCGSCTDPAAAQSVSDPQVRRQPMQGAPDASDRQRDQCAPP
jgi:hypothetical protein